MFAKLFISLAVVGAFVGTLNAIPMFLDQQDCPKMCPDLYAPICGTDGMNFREFRNECQLKSHNCRMQLNFMKTFAATTLNWCHTELVDNLNSLLAKLGNLELNKVKCLKPCAVTYEPVCISNGKYRLLADECVLVAVNCALGDKAEAFKNLGVDHC